MNRIILIGNGFDLAHGLKTSYGDFIEYIFENLYKIVNNTYVNCEYLNSLVLYDKNFRGLSFSNLGNSNDHYSKYIAYKNDNPSKKIKETNVFITEFLKPKNNHNWGAIERIYYDKLLQYFEIYKINKTSETLKSFKKLLNILNRDFSVIIKLLEKYLTEITDNYSDLDTDIQNKLDSSNFKNFYPIKNVDDGTIHYTTGHKFLSKFKNIDNKDVIGEVITPNSTLIVNFNYTKIANNYLEELKNTELIHIHGKLNDPNNKIIFGYGNEYDDSYKELEDLEIDEALEYIKSIKYLETDNYKNVIDFLEIDDYYVSIMGQSCSNTDKTLLNKIFEHKNCKNIYNYYYKNNKTDNWDSYSKNITRIFNNKQILRDIVSPKNICEPLK